MAEEAGERKCDNDSLEDFYTQASSARVEDLNRTIGATKAVDKKALDNVYLVVKYSFLDG